MITSYLDWAILAVLVFAYGLVAGRLKQTPLSGAVVFLLTGLILGPAGLGWLGINVTSENLRTIAELTLALILFTDAATANLPVLRDSRRLPIRLLALGLPLTILLGMGVAQLLLPALSPVEAAILSVVLAPTDAALGQPVVTNPAVPVAVREDLSAESGLNDGICVPLLLSLLAMAQKGSGAGDGVLLLGWLFLEQVGLGLVLGCGLAFLAARCRDLCLRRRWITSDWQPVLAIALPVCCFALAQQLGGSGFIACFCGGLTFGGLTPQERKQEELVAAEATADVLSLLTWVAFGSAVVALSFPQLSATTLLYGLFSLTLVRMVPVALATLGLRIGLWTTLFVGWFGPRGLASIVFGLLVLDSPLVHGSTIASIAASTVLLSIAAHGLSALGLVTRYGRVSRS
ncbi:cation:proton antiporter [Synechococcus sp. CBW1006]|uniref:cation:proton antiporter domain-containing protein n=1 Tax=Synechococcus sp. CBW1006 TaxID=1353138 RepID=UPI001938FA32|nr:cation:proton antiporter [Synechococcus sp. CBW1006]QPN66618.1 cation:proton antiporter [Synechococcus sp. CBW1006]